MKFGGASLFARRPLLFVSTYPLRLFSAALNSVDTAAFVGWLAPFSAVLL